MGTKKYLDRPSLWVVIITAILILAIVTIGVLGRFLLDEFSARVLLIFLIVLLSVLGLCALTYLEIRKRQVQKENITTAAKNGYYYQNIEPSAPRDPNWEYSDRSTLPAK